MPAGAADAHTLVGAYAMDAVSDADRARFDDHLTACPACQDEVRELREATARLAAAAAVVPRPGLKAMAMQAAAQTRQLPPAAAEPEPYGAPGPARARQHRAPSPARLRQAQWPARLRQARAGHLPLLPAAAAAVLVLMIVAAVLLVGGARHRLSLAQGKSMAVTRVLDAPDAATMRAKVSTGGTATVVMSHAQGRLVFTAAGLHALPSARRYELWVMGPAGARPAGMLAPQHGGMVTPMLVARLGAGNAIGLTVEPAAGSPQPTAPAIMLLGLRVPG